ncbi:hypothetical protein MFLAVUS_007044 [Mucor flavus]|uniref:YqaJ viral recombinase domain-containing protein n=1 Tax=Mucor flavus TaxID=439312 RepID=A0ABP9Z373_9FUNG
MTKPHFVTRELLTMSKNTKKLSCKQYLKEKSEKFSIVAFYEYFNFETRQSAEHALRGTVFTLNKAPKKNKKRVNELLTLLSLNDFEYLKNSAAEAFWSKLEARYSQVKRIYDQTRVQAESESVLLQDIIEKESEIEKKPANKKRKYILDISEIQSQRTLKPMKLDTKLAVEDRLSLSHIMMKNGNLDTTSLAVKEIHRGYTAFRPDCLIITRNGVEVGAIEIKPLDTCKELVDVDVCRVAEICKRQLHLRMKVARSTKELATFGIIVTGKHVFFNSLRLDTVDGTYKYFQHGQVSLPIFESTVTDMEVFLESFLSFKECIKESLASEEEEEELPNLFDEYSHFIKPTIALKDNKEKYITSVE